MQPNSVLAEHFQSIDHAQFERWVLESRQEDLHLDFKTVTLPSDLDRADRKNFAIAVSGFANSDGGLIVWGIECKRDQETGVDCATALRPITNAPAVVSKLQSLTGVATNPMVDGVLHRLIADDAQGAFRGFVVSFVPVSDRGPHMAKLGEDRYYKRSGDSFYKMEHFDIADMFGRRRRPALSVRVKCEREDGSTETERLSFLLLNSGRAAARYSGFHIELANVSLGLVSGPFLHNTSSLNDGRSVVSFDFNIGVVHPNGILLSAGYASVTRRDPLLPIVCEITTFCDGMDVSRNVVSLPSVARAMASVDAEDSEKSENK